MSTPRFSNVGGATAVLAALVLAGCNLAPKYSRPAIATPMSFKEAPATPGVAWTAAQPRDALPSGRWWEIYRDPRLNALEEQVEVSNQGIIAAAANFRAARAAVTAARSGYFPTITTAPSYTRSRASQTRAATVNGGAASGAPSTGTGGSAIVNDYVLPVDASYTVDLWRRVGNNVAASTANAQASAADLATALLSTQAELARDYFTLRALDAERQILDDTVGSYRSALDATTALYRNGIYSEEDVARAKTQLDAAVAQATDLGVSRAATEHAMAVLIGKAPADFSQPVSPLASQPPAVPVGLPSDLLERRPDIAAAERRVAAANAQIGIARAAYFPSLVLGAEGGWESAHLAQWFSWPSRFWSIGPQLAGTLFDGGARRAQTEQARAEFDRTVADYRGAVLGAFQAVEDNLAALRLLEAEAGQQDTAVESSNHLLELAMSRYHIGIDSYLNVVTAQTALLSNRETAVQIQLRRMTSSVALVLALGGGWDATELTRPRDVASGNAGGK